VKLLVFYAGGSLAELKRLVAEGARVVLWDEERAPELQAAGIAQRPASEYFDGDERERIEQAAMAWTKALGRKPLLGGLSARELLNWGHHSLWWWAELYLHHSTELPRYVRLIESFNRVLEAEAPDEVHALGLEAEEALLLSRTCTAWRMLYEGEAPRPTRSAAIRRVSWQSRWNTLKTLGSALKATLSGPAPRPASREGERALLFLSHAAFWRERRDAETEALVEYEHYFDRILPEAASQPDFAPFVVAVGPQAAFRRRSSLRRLREWLRLRADSPRYVHVNRYTSLLVFRRTWLATRLMRRAWRELRGAPGLREALSHSGVNFADLARDGFAATLLLQLPWAVRSYEESAALLRTLQPALLVLYAESSGWGRAALAAAADAGVPSVALQHGILYPTYFSYIHEPDEGACPRPTRTAVFGQVARDFLVTRGGYAPEALVLTGSPKFDELLKAAGSDRQALRERLGIARDERLLVLASRFRAIRSTHRAVGSAFAQLVVAVEQSPGVRLIVKPHPAELSAPYQAVLHECGSTRVSLAPAGAELVELLLAADALVTVESLSAIEALALGRPVIVLNMPTNLGALVESGAALGVAAGQDPRPAIEVALGHSEARERLEAARQAYLTAVAGGLDGQATARIVALLRDTARANGRGSV